MSAPPTRETGGSVSPGLPTPRATRGGSGTETAALLKTPTAQLSVNGGSQHPDKRRAGGHGPTLADEIEHLLPTPMANMNGASSREIEEGNPKHRLETAVALLPTPRATDGTNGGPNQRGSSGDLMLPSAVHRLGGNTPPPSPAGSPSSGDQHPRQLTIEDALALDSSNG